MSPLQADGVALTQAGDGPAAARAPWEDYRAGEWAVRQKRPWLGGGEGGVLEAQKRVGWLAQVPGNGDTARREPSVATQS